MPLIDEQSARAADNGKTALYLVMDSLRQQTTRQELRELLMATKFMEKAFRDLRRSDLIEKMKVIQKRVTQLLLINWEWLEQYRTSQYLPPEAYEDLKDLHKKLLEIEILRGLLLDLLLDAGIHADIVHPSLKEVPTVGGE